MERKKPGPKPKKQENYDHLKSPNGIFSDGKFKGVFYHNREKYSFSVPKLGHDGKINYRKNVLGEIEKETSTGQPKYFEEVIRFDKWNHAKGDETGTSRYIILNKDMYEYEEGELILENGKPIKKPQGWLIYEKLQKFAKTSPDIFDDISKLVNVVPAGANAGIYHEASYQQQRVLEDENTRLANELEKAKQLLKDLEGK